MRIRRRWEYYSARRKEETPPCGARAIKGKTNSARARLYAESSTPPPPPETRDSYGEETGEAAVGDMGEGG